MTRKTTVRRTLAARSSRRTFARVATSILLPAILLIALWFVVGSGSVEVREGLRIGVLVGSVVGPLIVVVVCVVTIRSYNKNAHRLIALAGPDCWGAPCVDPENRTQWRVLLVDAAGVHLVDRVGVARRDWGWESVQETSVERFPVALRTLTGVVLHLADGSRAELLLPSRTTLAFPLDRAKAAANAIGQRLADFRSVQID